MLLRVAKRSDVKASEITPVSVYRSRRVFLQTASIVGASALLAPRLLAPEAVHAGEKLQNVVEGLYSTDEELTPYDSVTTYNNFYELGSGKKGPRKNADKLRTSPWSIAVEGECAKPGVYQLEDFVKPHQLEERIYRLRCVEAWSMVIPWVGFALNKVIERFEPTSKAKFVEFITIYDPDMLPAQRRQVLDWPYTEGLRMDEAMHPLTTLAVGLYGEVLPNQNGAPIRLVVPWKYGFKSIKSIVKIRFVEQQPATAWNIAAPDEYGFYSNVNPNVDHPRWSQKRERRIGDFFKRDTLMFNGYADEVSHLYAGMDLKKYF